MGVAKRCAAANERLGRVGGEEDGVRGRGGQSFPVELEIADEDRERAEREANIAARREDGRLVLLQIQVVGERNALERREQARQPPDRRPGLAPGQLGHVGIELLRHHRRPRCGGKRKPHEAELGCRPQAQLLADPREVPEEHCRGVEVVGREVAIGDGVERVAHLAGRGRQSERGARQGPRAERNRCRLLLREAEPLEIAREHLDPREQVVAERHRLRALEVRVARHRRVRLRLGPVEEDERELPNRPGRLTAGIADVEPERGRDLVVARAAGVDLAPHRAERQLDRGVDVLRLLERVDALLSDPVESCPSLVELLVGQDARGVEALGVEERALAVVGQELGVVTAQELGDLRGELRAARPARPESHRGGTDRAG